ncbi:unnamed protein product [Paramecium octaurelia]|uniref:Ubiquitin-like domain-containing protein n=1 Tax=Paramecium octaurelia TaxID=43137 RepID=A0A8S1S277_PAROT|nr:unnamed protein product [Paramecium octaurelia]
MVFFSITCDYSFGALSGKTFLVDVQQSQPRVRDLKEQIKYSVEELENFEVGVIYQGNQLDNMDFLPELDMQEQYSINVQITKFGEKQKQDDCSMM